MNSLIWLQDHDGTNTTSSRTKEWLEAGARPVPDALTTENYDELRVRNPFLIRRYKYNTEKIEISADRLTWPSAPTSWEREYIFHLLIWLNIKIFRHSLQFIFLGPLSLTLSAVFGPPLTIFLCKIENTKSDAQPKLFHMGFQINCFVCSTLKYCKYF